MGVHTTWDDPEKTIMRFIIENPWRMDDIYRAIDGMKADLKAANITYPIGAILDTININTLPTGIMQSTGPMIQAMQPEVALIVVASPSRFLYLMHSIFTRLYPRYADTFQFALTRDDARALVAKRLKTSEPR